MKLYKITVFTKTGKVVEPYPRVYAKSQGVSAVKGYWLSPERMNTYEKFSGPYSVDVKTLEVTDDQWE